LTLSNICRDCGADATSTRAIKKAVMDVAARRSH